MTDATRQGDPVTDLIIEQSRWLRRIARAMTHCDSDADDLLQETLMRAVVHRRSFAEGTSVRAWTRTILRRVWLTDAAMRRRRRTSIDTDAGDMLHHAASGGRACMPALWTHERFLDTLDDDVKQAFERLPETYRTPLFLLAVEGLSVVEIARRLGVPEGTAMSRIHRARERMKRAIQPPRRPSRRFAETAA